MDGRNRNVMWASLVALALGACGGGGKKHASLADETEGGDGDASGLSFASNDGSAVTPEQQDAVQTALDRKRTAASRCLTDAIDNGDAPKNARGKVTIELVVQPSGKASDVKIVKSTIQNEAIESCVVDLVEKIDFDPLPEALPWSYTYAFESF